MTATINLKTNFAHEMPDVEEEPGCRAMKAIVFAVQEIIADALADKETLFSAIHPRTLTIMIINNIMVNLFLSACPPEYNTLETRLKMARSMVDEINKVFIDCIEKIETVRSISIDTKQ
jgi:hypothetical protein